MKVHPEQLVPGCLITQDVMGQVVQPLVPKNTIIEPVHILVLKKFQVGEVVVANKLASGEDFKVEDLPAEEANSIEKDQDDFFDVYVKTVKQTINLFEQWKPQSKLEIAKIREMLNPLITQAEETPDLLLKLHHFSDKRYYFYHHIVANAAITAFLTKKLQYDQQERRKIALAAFLADLGMLLEDKDLYTKDRVLTEEEFARVRKHPALSYKLVDGLEVSKDVKVAILQHHERLDGSGYPMGASHDKIHAYAKIIAVSDMFHAMTCERVYRRKESPFKVIEEMLQGQFGKLDMKVINALVDSIITFGNGTKVKLSNNETGTIVFTDEKSPTRPFIRLSNKDIINLDDYRDIHIEEII
ncbi:HD-GYP domain-containing protein [Halalkalibacillus halophilus]|uniref:HD-GYP domain-containing protein n=1 Tax=Halalkalibacillus halophilus TaxID=392827 RepID=UPI000402B06C|nr:HD domain-containing phosphohydrolase [Halalkalibacillus halophilus]